MTDKKKDIDKLHESKHVLSHLDKKLPTNFDDEKDINLELQKEILLTLPKMTTKNKAKFLEDLASMNTLKGDNVFENLKNSKK